ncbi:hypothetical protein ACNKHO_07000 [Shigella flexneri]
MGAVQMIAKPIEGIERPAPATAFPPHQQKGKTVVLTWALTWDRDSTTPAQFAVMGSVWQKTWSGSTIPALVIEYW